MADLPVTPLADYGALLQSYPTAQAGIQQTQATTAGINLANQQKSLQLGYYQKLLDSMHPAVNDQHPGNADDQTDPATSAAAVNPTGKASDALTIADAGLDPAHVTQHATKQYAVRDMWTQQEMQQMQLAIASGVPGAADGIKALHEQRIKTATSQAQIGASTAYDNAAAVSEAPEGAALDTLSRIHPEAASRIASMGTQKGWTDDQIDQFTRTYSDEIGNAVHKYSGRDVEIGTDGVMRDKTTGRPILGGNPAGLSAKDWAASSQEGSKIVTVTRNGRETQMPQWEADGATSLASWVRQQANKGEGGPGAPKPAVAGAPGSAASPGQTVAGLPKPAADFVRSGPGAPAFLNTGNAKPTDEEKDLQTQYGKDRAAALAESGAEIQTSQKTLVNANRAQAALDKLGKGTTLGPGSGGWAEIQTFIRNWTGQQAADAIENSAAMRQLLGKELNQDQLNTILGKLHGEGAQVRLGAQESSLILGSLSANPALSRDAITQMLTWEKSDAAYDLTKAQTKRAWVVAGRDVQQFEPLYGDKFPRSTNVQTAIGTETAPPAKTATAPPAPSAVTPMKALPPPAKFAGKVFAEKDSKGNVTGRFKSDGTKWVAVK